MNTSPDHSCQAQHHPGLRGTDSNRGIRGPVRGRGLSSGGRAAEGAAARASGSGGLPLWLAAMLVVVHVSPRMAVRSCRAPPLPAGECARVACAAGAPVKGSIRL